MTEVQLKAGDTLSALGDKYLSDYSQWREIAYLNNLNIFDNLPIGKTITLPDREELKKVIDSKQAEVVASANSEIKSVLTEITNSREVQSIAKTLGVDTSQLLKDLDLTPLAKSLPSASGAVDQAWQLIGWVLTLAIAVIVPGVFM